MTNELDCDAAAGPLWRRLLWLAAIWAASVGALFVVASIIRFWIRTD